MNWKQAFVFAIQLRWLAIFNRSALVSVFEPTYLDNGNQMRILFQSRIKDDSKLVSLASRYSVYLDFGEKSLSLPVKYIGNKYFEAMVSRDELISNFDIYVFLNDKVKRRVVGRRKHVILKEPISFVATVKIPKIIWSYWEQGEMPEFLKRCLQSMKKYHPDYKIYVITKRTLRTYISAKFPKNFYRINVQGRADWVRLQLLYTYGGVWIDVSTIFKSSIAYLMKEADKNGKSMILFKLRNYNLENWFIASVPNNPLIKAWIKEFEVVIEKFRNNGRSYAKYLKKSYGLKIWEEFKADHIPEQFYGYLTQHHALRKIHIMDGINFDQIQTFDACDGPYLFHCRYDGDYSKIAHALMTTSINDNPPFTKISGWLRKVLLSTYKKNKSKLANDSILVKELDLKTLR